MHLFKIGVESKTAATRLFSNGKNILISLTPIYAYLTQRGYTPQGETIVIEDWPVQFLPVYDELTEETLAEAINYDFICHPPALRATMRPVIACLNVHAAHHHHHHTDGHFGLG